MIESSSAEMIIPDLPFVYGHFKSKSNPTADAVMSPNYLFQMTISEKHTINIAGLKEIITAMKLDKEKGKDEDKDKAKDDIEVFYLIFVVPAQVFATFSVTPLAELSNLPKNMRILVLAMPEVATAQTAIQVQDVNDIAPYAHTHTHTHTHTHPIFTIYFDIYL